MAKSEAFLLLFAAKSLPSEKVYWYVYDGLTNVAGHCPQLVTGQRISQ